MAPKKGPSGAATGRGVRALGPEKPDSTKNTTKNTNTNVLIGVGVFAAVGLVCGALGAWAFWTKRMKVKRTG